jgi:hypothetical protein
MVFIPWLTRILLKYKYAGCEHELLGRTKPAGMKDVHFYRSTKVFRLARQCSQLRVQSTGTLKGKM